MTSTNIHSLSPELVASVGEFLDSDGLFNLRFSNRYVCECCLHLFIRRYFRERTHLITQHSLDALLDMTQQPKFGHAMQRLVISRRYLAKLSDEMSFIRDSGVIAVYLTEVLRNAPNCREIAIDEDCDEPWGLTGFLLDRIVDDLNPTGAGGPVDDASEMRTHYSRQMYYDEGIIEAIVVAITMSGAEITTFDMSSILSFDSKGLKIPQSYHPRLSRSPWVNTLTTLKLQLDMATSHFDVSHVKSFVRQFPRLENFVLKVRPFEGEYSPGDTLVELDKFGFLVEDLYIPRLRTLELSDIHCLLGNLQEMIENHRETLTELSLLRVSSCAGANSSWRSLITALRDRFRLEKLSVSACAVSDRVLDFEFEDVGHHNGDSEDDDSDSNDDDEGESIRLVDFEDQESGDSSASVDVFGRDPQVYDRLLRGLREGMEPKSTQVIRFG